MLNFGQPTTTATKTGVKTSSSHQKSENGEMKCREFKLLFLFKLSFQIEFTFVLSFYDQPINVEKFERKYVLPQFIMNLAQNMNISEIHLHRLNPTYKVLKI